MVVRAMRSNHSLRASTLAERIQLFQRIAFNTIEIVRQICIILSFVLFQSRCDLVKGSGALGSDYRCSELLLGALATRSEVRLRQG